MDGPNAFYYKLRYFLLPDGTDFYSFARSLNCNHVSTVTELFDKGLITPYFCQAYSLPVRLVVLNADEPIPVTVKLIEKADYDRRSLLPCHARENCLKAHAADFVSEFGRQKRALERLIDLADVTDLLPPLLPSSDHTPALYIGRYEGKPALFASSHCTSSPVLDAAIRYVISRLKIVHPEGWLFFPYIPKGFPCPSECREYAEFHIRQSKGILPVLHVVSAAKMSDVALHLYSAIGEDSLKASFSAIIFERTLSAHGEAVKPWQVELIAAEASVQLPLNPDTEIAASLGAKIGVLTLPKVYAADDALPVPVSDAIAFLSEKGYARALYKTVGESIEICFLIADETGFSSMLDRFSPCFDRFLASFILL